MALGEDIKERVERLTGVYRPSRARLAGLVRARKPAAYRFGDDGRIPNNRKFPLLIYRGAVDLSGPYDPAAVLEDLFATHGWKDSWRDGIYPFRHFHTKTHEVLGFACGSVRIEFGGAQGRVIELVAGDVAVVPAGTSHKRRSASRDLLVVGAYPAGGDYDEPRPGEVEHDKAVDSIAKVNIPRKDPVYGKNGPLLRLWRKPKR